MMTCDQAGVLLHALIDGELDAGNALAMEEHLAACPRCSAQRQRYGDLHRMLGAASLRYKAPAALRRRVEGAAQAARPMVPSRRSVLKGFAMGSVTSAAMAAGFALVVFRGEDEQRIVGEAVSAHLRSLQAEHLTDVQSSDQHTVKPWFNGKFDVSPPVMDLTAQGFRLIGGRLDYIDGKPVAALVYKRRAHIINLFVAKALGAQPLMMRARSIQGFNTLHWTDEDLALLAVSDLNADELEEFAAKFQSALHTGGG